MPKSKSRNENKCIINCLLCEKVKQFHKYNDISTLLANVTEWDIEYASQFKYIKKYECLVCCFKTSIFCDWKCHIMSQSHLTDSHKVQNIHSYICCNKTCKVVLYGSEKSLLKHNEIHQNNTNYIVSNPKLMVEVMKRFGTEQSTLYFCSHCKQIAEKSIHAKSEIIKNLKNLITHYCKFCRVEFFSSPELIDVHSLSVEHLTLKCFDELSTTAKINSKKIKLSEPKLEQSNPSNENNLRPVDQNVHTNNLVKLPMIVLNKFEKISPYKGECELCKLINCKLCNISLRWDSNEMISHLLNCEYKYDLTGSNETSIKTFECNVCDYSTNLVNDHKMHMVSYLHLTNCHDTHNLYSYFCNICDKFMYSHITAIKNHWKLHKNDQIIAEMPLLFMFMANVFKDFNTNPNRISFIHYYGKNESNEFSKIISVVCFYCKIEFHTSVDDYNMHQMTYEHIILKFLSPKMYVMHENSLTPKMSKPSMNDLIDDISLLQNSDLVQDIENQHLKNGQDNQSETNLDKSPSEPLDIIQNEQKIIENNVSMNELEYRLKCISIKGLIPSLKKTQYTKYFNHKIKILDVLRQYKDRIIKTLSYYCDVCDFMTEEKYIWDNHIQLQHQDCLKPEIYCYSCSMWIFGSNIEKHNITMEHSIILQFLNSLELIENNLEKNTALINSVESNMLDEMPCIKLKNSNENEELKLKNNKISEEELELQHIGNNVCKTNDRLLHKDKDDSKINSEMISTSTSVNDDYQNYELKSDAISSSYIQKLMNKSTKNNNLPGLIHANCSKDVDVQKKYDCKDVSISTENIVSYDMEIYEVKNNIFVEDSQSQDEQINTVEFNEDIAYGEYVTERLNLIENTTVKQNLKLEIDYLFYTKIKQLFLK